MPERIVIELVAAEPEVLDPISIAFDESGRLWVVEMGDYPNGPAPGKPPASQVKCLEDRDGDGRFETARVFADGLLFATGVEPWRGGVIVTVAGEIIYLKDEDGDGRADVRETWFTGFSQGNSQLRANHPRWNRDGRIYVANGLRGGTVAPALSRWKLDPTPLTLGSMDFCFDPETGRSETVAGMGQFGLTFDATGNRFLCSNRNPCRQVILENRYLKRNPYLAVRDVAIDVSPSGADSRVYPVSRSWTTSNLHAGQFTAACGVSIYEGNALPAEFRGNCFVCEPTGNLVHRDRLRRDGVVFQAEPDDSRTEFLATDDEWFRPVDLTSGPDGALYVVDMYRAVIEHPEWMPPELRQRPDLLWGSDRGRIYRVRAAGGRAPIKKQAVPRSTADLVADLESDNDWTRTTAMRLLWERRDPTAIPLLAPPTSPFSSPLARLDALSVLRGLGALDESVLLGALRDPDARVREGAVRLSEPLLAASSELRSAVIGLADDEVPRVRFQVALALGEFPPEESVVSPLGAILRRDPGDEWITAAVLSSARETASGLLLSLLQDPQVRSDKRQEDRLKSLRAVAETVGARQRGDELQEIMNRVATIASASAISVENKQLAWIVAAGLGQGFARRGGSFRSWIMEQSKRSADFGGRIDEMIRAALADVRQSELPEGVRLAALEFLKSARYEQVGDVLLDALAHDSSQLVRSRTVQALATFGDSAIGPALLEQFSMQTPALRREILQALVADPQRLRLLLREIEEKRLPASELDALTIARIVKHADPEIREQAQRVLAASLPADRQQALRDYQVALQLKGDVGRGRTVFEKQCATCHRVGNLGHSVAPDISDARDRTPQALLNDILNPNQAIDNNYVSYTVVTLDGRSHTGIIGAESGSSITLKQPDGKTEVILRQEIELLRSNGISLMPDGMEKNIPQQEMADLISFIKNWRYVEEGISLPTQ